MNYTIKSREAWDAKPPTRTYPLDWSKVTMFIVHYSGASREQSIASIQDYCMRVKGHSDIDYNALVKDGVGYEGRWNNKGGHAENLNSVSWGVCIVGNDGEATEADFQMVKALYDYACTQAGRKLTVYGHGQAPGQNTSCPGNQIRMWVERGMPTTNIPHDGQADWITRLVGALPEIRQGSSGLAVARAQGLLSADLSMNGANGIDIDGDFGPVTHNTVRQYQSRNALSVDGIIGPKTWTKLIAG